MKNLNETVTMMNSADYKERFKAEYHQTKIRHEKLKVFNNKIEAANMTGQICYPCGNEAPKKVEMPKHDCPDYLLKEQERVMSEYLHILEVRAVIEGIDLEDVCNCYVGQGMLDRFAECSSDSCSAKETSCV
jgi:hypothetical protein